MKKVIQAKVLSHVAIGADVFKLDVDAADIANDTFPGQFAQLKVNGLIHPLLRRPISVADVDKTTGSMTFIYRVVGEGTRLLSEIPQGGMVDIIAPLGNGFSLTAKRPLLVGGGMGIAPLIYLAKEFCQAAPEVLLAGRSAAEMFWQELFSQSCKNIHITTDDGSMGVKGTALALLPELIATGKYDYVYTCGPSKMMQAVAEVAIKNNIACEVSLEKYMACGLGACLSCSCATKSGNRVKVCTDGPVFAAQEVQEWH